ncbi:hypothetical protein [Leucobacter sp. cx-169]|uniref:hypothetical protein n=1 Tax=Leucobacter sp. cx-169 TaxID=2770549 RepID=UPI00165DA15A|nr:hypothetical protein [Leucobacter sp. cx-169]MBC9927238.1 hypothetical protein [Leucobacter sp. cx-169]
MLDLNDTLTRDVFVRSLVPTETFTVNSVNPYGGQPENTLLWVPIAALLGGAWIGRPVSDLVKLTAAAAFDDPFGAPRYQVWSHEVATGVPLRMQLRGLEQVIYITMLLCHEAYVMPAPSFSCKRCGAGVERKPEHWTRCAGCGWSRRWVVDLHAPWLTLDPLELHFDREDERLVTVWSDEIATNRSKGVS